MKNPAILSLLVAALACLPCAAPAAEEPDAVYAKFHRAAMSGNLDEMLDYGLDQRRAEMRGASATTKDAALRLVQFMMPRAFKLENKTVNARTGRAMLIVSGPWEGGQRGMETVYGTVRMLMENGAWKVDETTWSNEKPEIPPAAKPAAPPAADKAAGKAAAAAKTPQAVGSASPGRRLGDAKPECVYKPVMTAEDVERCR